MSKSTRGMAYDRADRASILTLKMSEVITRDLRRLVDGPCDDLDEAEFLAARVRRRLAKMAEMVTQEQMRWIGRV